jgi:hypothetical protein
VAAGLHEQLVDEQADISYSSPMATMTPTSAPEPSPTTGVMPRSVLDRPVLNIPSPIASEGRSEYSEADGLYGDLEVGDYPDHTRISLEDLGVGHGDQDAALHFDHDTMTGITGILIFSTFLIMFVS